MKKNTINRLIAGALVFGSVLSINTINANAVNLEGFVKTEYGLKYYDKNGDLVKDKRITINGKEFSFNSKGITNGDLDDLEDLGGATFYSSDEAREASLKYDAKYPLTNECSESYKKSDDRWCNKDGKWYFNHNKYKDYRRIIDSWWEINGFWYHFDKDGAMDKDTIVKDVKGNECKLNSDGVLINRKEPDLGDEYGLKYAESEAEVKKGWVMNEADGMWYYYNENGEKQVNKTIIEGDKKFVLNAEGQWIQ